MNADENDMKMWNGTTIIIKTSFFVPEKTNLT